MDAAFGPSGLALASQPDPRVQEGQRLLKALGYDPGPINGVWSERTASALTAYWFAIGKENLSRSMPLGFTDDDLARLRESAQKAGVQAQQGQVALQSRPVSALVEEPFWKKKTFVGLAAAAAAIGVYLYLRGEEKPAEPLADAKPKRERKKKSETDEPEREEKVIEGEVVDRSKCSRTPVLAFEAGETVELPQETTTAPSV